MVSWFLGDEDQIADVVFEFLDGGFPFDALTVRCYAYQYARMNSITGFSPIKKKGGRVWFDGWMKRYPQFTLKNAKTLSLVRALGANRGSITFWFGLYKGWLQEIGFNNPNKLWNVDESGLQDNYKPGKIIGLKKQPAMQIVGGEKGTLFTVVTYISAGGLKAPPILIFKASNVKREWVEAAPAGWLVRASKSGYINAALFEEYGKLFVTFLKEHRLDTGAKNMVILDLHKSHLFNFSYMNNMIANNVKVVSFPPHCTHALQPLDDLPFAKLKALWNAELGEQNFQMCAAKINNSQLVRMLASIWDDAMTSSIIVTAFSNCGLYPVNANATKIRQRIGPSKIIKDKSK